MRLLLPYLDPDKISHYLDDKTLDEQIVDCYNLLELSFNDLNENKDNSLLEWIRTEERWIGILYLFTVLLNEYKHRHSKEHKLKTMEAHFNSIEQGKIESRIVNKLKSKIKKEDLILGYLKPKDLPKNTTIDEYYRNMLKFMWFKDKKKPKWTNRKVPTDYLIIDLKRRTK